MSNIHQILQRYWGYLSFRPMQAEIIESVLQGNDTLALLPTGGGKSICFQVPALAQEGICIVVSPLIALMKDQVEQLKKRGINATAIYSGMSKREIDIALDNCVYGQVKFLYLSPERLQTEIVKVRVQKMKVNLLAIDEAHCISQWGYDFRPPYLEINAFRELIPDVSCLALTATATPEVRDDIMERLGFPKPIVFQKSFARDNLSYSVLDEEDKEGRLVKMLQRVDGSAVIYARSRKKCQLLSDYLQQWGVSADYYHAGLSTELRGQKQDEWIQGRTRVMVATNAFGMGIDKPDVRLVAHLDLPDTLEAYYQEAGRAGRDGRKAYAAVLWQKSDNETLLQRVSQSFPSLEQLKRVYQALANYYKIAVGSNLMATYDFQLSEFAQTYRLDYLTAFHAIRRLEEQGLLQLNDAFYAPPRLMFALGKSGLYEFQIANPNLDPIIKGLLRVYGGELFIGFMAISESKLATLLKVTPGQIQKQLEYMKKAGVVEYFPQQDQPQLTFTQPRASVASFPFDTQAYGQRQRQAVEKARAVARYMQHAGICRTEQLLAYFGEEYMESCGVCDACLKAKREQKQEVKPVEGSKLVAYVKKRGEVLAEELIEEFRSIADKDALLAELRALLDSGMLRYSENGRLQASDE